MAAGFLRLHLTCTLHKDTGDNLQAVGNPVVKFLEQDLFVLGKVFPEFFEQSQASVMSETAEAADIMPSA